MKRYGIVIIAVSVLLIVAVLAAAAPVSIVDSKHNLSSTGPGTIKSQAPGLGGTSQICVFCHTPHSARLIEAPLWNRTDPTGPYTVYASDVMSYLSITPEQPETGAIHVKTRICMSCHDGTIALGNLVNLPYGMSGSVSMQGTAGGMMPQTAAGYVGTDIRDDHPVAVKHSPGGATGQDPELVSILSSSVRLYNIYGGRVRSSQTSGDYVECTSCHDPHDNQYGDFLVQSNQNSAICTACHTKTGYTSALPNESIHTNSTQSYSPPTNAGDAGNPQTLGTTVGGVKCMDCHFPHKAGITIGSSSPNAVAGRYLLTYQEEQSCFNTTNRWGQANVTACHGNIGGTVKNIQTQVAKFYGHHVGNYTGTHRATEGRTGWNWTGQPGSAMHVECDDCHNSHSAGALLHTTGTNSVLSTYSVYGAGGVSVNWPAGGWSGVFTSTSFTYIQPYGAVETSGGVANEYQICLKCHSTFATGTPYPAGAWTDQAKEFNPTNASYHSVVQVNPASYGTTSWTGGSSFSNTSRMYCSDCHGSESAAGPQGPHGSSNNHILKGPGTGFVDYYTSKGTDQPTTDLCFNCHNATAYQTGSATTSGTGFRTTAGTNLHTQHRILSSSSSTSANGYVCVNCHVKIPHGYKQKALIMVGTDAAEVPTYAPAGGAKITSFVAGNLPAPLNYGVSKAANCITVNGCHQ